MALPLERAIEQKIADAAAEQKAKILTQQNLWPELLTAKDILNLPPDPTRWIWDKCLPTGGCSMLVAKPKVGKSTFAVCLALAVARGMTFLNRETQQGPVAYLSLDASLSETAELFRCFGLRENDPVFFHAGAPPHDSVNWIMHRIKQCGVKLVIVDTMQRLFKFKNINDYSEVTNAIEPLLESARLENCHVMVSHHAGKQSLDDLDAAIGSTALRGMFYQYLHLKLLPNSQTRIFRTEGRGGENFVEYAVGFDRVGFLDIDGSKEEAEIREIRPIVLSAVIDAPESTERELRSVIIGQPRIIGKALRELVAENEIERIGKGKRGDPFKYVPARKLHLVSGETHAGLFEQNRDEINQKPNVEEKSGKSSAYAGLFDIENQQSNSNGESSIKSDTYSGLLHTGSDRLNEAEKRPKTRIDQLMEEIDAEKKPR